MSQVNLPKEVRDCLENEMQIKMDHFFDKYNSFDDDFKSTANNLLSNMLTDSTKEGSFDGDTHYYEESSDDENEFMQAMFDCFNVFSKHKGLEIHREIYAHPSRGGGDWFPIVIIASCVQDYSGQPLQQVLYRGCSLESFENESYTDRQSWTFDFDTAKAFAFTNFSNISGQERVVIKAIVKNTDIVWIRAGESEVVLSLGFKPLSSKVEMDYDKYCKSKNS